VCAAAVPERSVVQPVVVAEPDVHAPAVQNDLNGPPVAPPPLLQPQLEQRSQRSQQQQQEAPSQSQDQRVPAHEAPSLPLGDMRSVLQSARFLETDRPRGFPSHWLAWNHYVQPPPQSAYDQLIAAVIPDVLSRPLADCLMVGVYVVKNSTRQPSNQSHELILAALAHRLHAQSRHAFVALLYDTQRACIVEEPAFCRFTRDSQPTQCWTPALSGGRWRECHAVYEAEVLPALRSYTERVAQPGATTSAPEPAPRMRLRSSGKKRAAVDEVKKQQPPQPRTKRTAREPSTKLTKRKPTERAASSAAPAPSTAGPSVEQHPPHDYGSLPLPQQRASEVAQQSAELVQRAHHRQPSPVLTQSHSSCCPPAPPVCACSAIGVAQPAYASHTAVPFNAPYLIGTQQHCTHGYFQPLSQPPAHQPERVVPLSAAEFALLSADNARLRASLAEASQDKVLSYLQSQAHY
jgi:hypothetical protein